MTDEKIRVEILKTDGTETYRIPVVNGESGQTEEWTVEGKGFLFPSDGEGGRAGPLSGQKSIFKDLEKYPKGYYLVKKKEILRLCGIQRILWIITRFQRLPGG